MTTLTNKINFIYTLGFCLCLIQLQSGVIKKASAAVSKDKKVQTFYTLKRNGANVKTTFQKIKPHINFNESSLLEILKSQLESYPFISSVTISNNGSKKTNLVDFSWANNFYYETDMNSIVHVRLQLPAPITLMFKSREVRTHCNNGGNTISAAVKDNYVGGGGGGRPRSSGRPHGSQATQTSQSTSASCDKNEFRLSIEGPIYIQGNYATAVNTSSKLENGMKLHWYAKMAKLNKTLEFTFKQEKQSLPKSISDFMSSLNVRLSSNKGAYSINASNLASNSVFSSRSMNIAIARFLRSINEKVVSK